MSSIWTAAPNKIKELNQLLRMYETAIIRQEELLDKVVRGRFTSTQLSDKVLYALVNGDLKILTDKKAEILSDLDNLERLNEEKSYNGYHSAQSDTDA